MGPADPSGTEEMTTMSTTHTTRRTASRAATLAAGLTTLAAAFSVAPAGAVAAPVTGLDPARSGATGLTEDPPSVIAEPPEVLVPEGRSGTFTVRLSHQPSGTVFVYMRGTGTGTWAGPPVLLMFGPGDWSTPKWYSLYSVQDADTVDDFTTITLSVTGYQPDTVTLRQIDDD